MAEVLAAELGADTEVAGELEDLLLELRVAEAVTRGRVSGRGQFVEVLGARVLGRLERELGARAADDDGEVVGRARGGAEAAQLLVEELEHALRIQDRLRLLVEERLVRAAAALGHEEELVGRLVPRLAVGVDLDLCGQVGAGVLLVPHRHRSHLAVAQVELGVRVEDALRQCLFVGRRRAVDEHLRALLAHDDGGAGVLAHRQHAGSRDVGVLEQVQGHELVVVAGLGVVENAAQLREVRRTQVVGDVVHRSLREELECTRVDLEERAPARALDAADALVGELAVGRRVLTDRKEVRVREICHALSLSERVRSAVWADPSDVSHAQRAEETGQGFRIHPLGGSCRRHITAPITSRLLLRNRLVSVLT